jgi:hypothetical protein
MRTIRLAILGFALAFTVVGGPAAHAIDKSAKAARTKAIKGTIGTTTGTVSVELTSQECKGMGGTVSDTPTGDPKCKTAQMCFTTDKHGVIRTACIDEVAAD